MDFVSHRPESRDCVKVTDSMISGYDDPSDWSEGERDDYLAQAPFHLNATRFAATLLLADSQVTFGLLAEVDFFLKDAIDQPYDKIDGIQAR